ncbi:DUF1643 domain-containing protein [Asaia bogorensis]|uniref:DUF1643 domain-containing protein n=1 Tax=Asaia bogorensis TaxID=91915 RepID=UPI000EFAF5EB|nr:DUF1643 domain-containing protein [Asaia bogorensis]
MTFSAKTHHVGASRPLRLQGDVTSTALYDGPGDCYRYRLHRVWAPEKPSIMWLMMNPSVATEYGDDRTVAKCQRYAREWGYGAMFVGNSFGYRCTDQKRLLEVDDPVGPGNDAALLDMARQADKVILAYGSPTHPSLRARGNHVAQTLHAAGIPLFVLRLSKGGRPEHPLYLPSALTPVRLDEAFFKALDGQPAP